MHKSSHTKIINLLTLTLMFDLEDVLFFWWPYHSHRLTYNVQIWCAYALAYGDSKYLVKKGQGQCHNGYGLPIEPSVSGHLHPHIFYTFIIYYVFWQLFSFLSLERRCVMLLLCAQLHPLGNLSAARRSTCFFIFGGAFS